MNILFTCAGRRNYLLHYFKEIIGDKGQIIAADMQMSAPAMAVADKAIVVPEVYAENYIETLLDICNKQSIDALISLNDLELPILSNVEDKFTALGVKLIVSDSNVIEICFDKWKTAQFAQNLGIKVPKTYLTLSDAKSAIQSGEIEFPLVIKPRWGSASIGIEFPESLGELDLAFRLISIKLSRSILFEASKVDFDHAILIQEKIHGKEYGLDVLNDFNRKTNQVFAKEKLSMRAGETDKAVLRNRPELEAIGWSIGEKLGHIGNLDCDIFEKDKELYLLEMNPRFGGGYPFTHMAGGNYPAAILAFLQGKEYDFDTSILNYDQGFAKCDTLIKIPLNT